MNKSEFIKAISEKSGVTQKDTVAVYEALVETVTETLKKGEKIQLVGFGTFEVKDVPAKIGVNPATGAKISIPESKKPALKFGKAYKDLFN